MISDFVLQLHTMPAIPTKPERNWDVLSGSLSNFWIVLLACHGMIDFVLMLLPDRVSSLFTSWLPANRFTRGKKNYCAHLIKVDSFPLNFNYNAQISGF